MIFLLTAFSVSIDAYVCALAVSLSAKKRIIYIIFVVLFTFILSAIALMIGNRLSRYKILFKVLGGCLFLFLGIKNLCETKKGNVSENINAPMVGFGVGTDAAIACLSYAVGFLDGIFIVTVMSVFHGAFFALGQCTAQFLKTAERASFVSGVFLILLGVFKFLALSQ